MLFFHSNQKRPIGYKIIYFILPIVIAILAFATIEYMNKTKPLWTPEDVLLKPIVRMKDISSNGKYALLEIIHSFQKGKDFSQLSQCVLVNNEDLTQSSIGTSEHGCSSPHFIGKEDAFSYLLQNEEGTCTLFIKNMVSKKTTEVQKFDKGFGNYAFAPDGQSFIYTNTEDAKDRSSRIVAGEEDMVTTRLYLQKLDQNLKPIGVPQLLTPPPLTMYNHNSISYTWSSDSSKIAFTTSKPVWKSVEHMSIHVIFLKNNKIEIIDEGDYTAEDIRFSPDGQKLVFIKHPSMGQQNVGIIPLKEMESRTIQVVDLKTKKPDHIIAPDIRDIAGWTEDNKELIVLEQALAKVQLCSLDITSKTLKRMVVPHITCVGDATLSKNRKYIGFGGANLHHPEEAYVSNLNDFVPKKISSVNKGIDLSQIPAHSLKWKSFDGLEIEGILIYPQGYKKKQKIPLIVSVHGGPAGMEAEQFIGNVWLSEFSPAVFASQGYGVLMVNYRGSLGYGNKFLTLNYQDLGGGDFKDIMSGIDYLIAQGIADPDQLFIHGHSYGGFMSAWAVGHTHRFKAAVVNAGIIDWISDSATNDYPTPIESDLGGYYWENYDLWRKVSPLNYVKNVRTPTLILQGLDDARVPRTQAQQFYQALRERKVPTRLVYYFNEDHNYKQFSVMLDAMNETIDWFKFHRE